MSSRKLALKLGFDFLTMSLTRQSSLRTLAGQWCTCETTPPPSRLLTRDVAPEYVVWKVNIAKTSLIIASVYSQRLSLNTRSEFTGIIGTLGEANIIAREVNAQNAFSSLGRWDPQGKKTCNILENIDITLLIDWPDTFPCSPTYCSCLDLALSYFKFYSGMTWCTDIDRNSSDDFLSFCINQGLWIHPSNVKHT